MGSVTLDIRPIRPQDRAVWGALWSGYLDSYGSTLPETVYETSFARLLSDASGTFSGRLAWLGAEAVGLVHWVVQAHMWRPEGVCYLQDLFTAPQARGQGVARALIETVYRAADAGGTPQVFWLTREDNKTARRLYDRVGVKTPFIRYDRVVS